MPETALERKRRLQKKWQCYQLKRSLETDEEKQASRAKCKLYADKESEEQRCARLKRQRERQQQARTLESTEQHICRLEKQRKRQQQARAVESAVQQICRLSGE